MKWDATYYQLASDPFSKIDIAQNMTRDPFKIASLFLFYISVCLSIFLSLSLNISIWCAGSNQFFVLEWTYKWLHDVSAFTFSAISQNTFSQNLKCAQRKYKCKKTLAKIKDELFFYHWL